MRSAVWMTTLAVLALAGTAAAAPIAVNVNVRLRVHMGVPAGGTTVLGQSAWTSGTVTVDQTAGTLQVPAGLLSVQSLVVPLTQTIASVTAFSINAQNGAGSFSNGGAAGGACPGPLNGGTAGACVQGGGLGGVMPIQGTAIPLPFSTNIMLSNLGAGGTTTTGSFIVQGAPWTTRTAAVTTSVSHTWMTLMGTGSLSPLLLNLVTPFHVSVGGLPAGMFLELQIVPEPGVPLLMLAGLAACVGVRRRRRA